MNNGDNSSTYPDDTHAVRPSDKYDARLHFNCADDEMKAFNENATKISSVYPFAARLLKQAYGPVRLSLIRYNSVGERNESQPQQNCHLDISEGTQQHLINISQEDSQDIVTCKTQKRNVFVQVNPIASQHANRFEKLIFTRNTGIKPFKHVLVPRRRGFQLILNHLHDCLDALYDVTTVFADGDGYPYDHGIPAPGLTGGLNFFHVSQ
ncbi:unnamed protein product [Trichobilharzia szidati]|nr:unnamed protein product [Trichobilharzia szidati]